MAMIYTVTFFGSTCNPKEIPEKELAEACDEQERFYALVDAGEESEAVWALHAHMEFERQRQEKMLEPRRKKFREEYPDQEFVLHLIYTALFPLAVDSWKAVQGRQEVHYKYQLGRAT